MPVSDRTTHLVENVFTISGVPTHTFVRPTQFDRLTVALRTPGRGVVVEGPTGIGKSTAVTKALAEIGRDVVRLSAKRPADVEYIHMLPGLAGFGTVVVDDFHRLDDDTKRALADLLTVVADTEDESRKLVVIGINRAGRSLIDAAADLANRVDVIRLETEPAAKVADLVARGSAALDIQIAARHQIVAEAAGGFHLAQLLCLEACVQAGCLATGAGPVSVDVPFPSIRERVLARQADRFGATIRDFARGTPFRPGGRAPYLHILRWLAESGRSSICLPEQIRKHPTEKASVAAVLEQGFLERMTNSAEVSRLLHYDPVSRTLSVEDPLLVFYLRNLNWPEFVTEVGFTDVDHDQEYDVALSFAGEDRALAEYLLAELRDRGHTVFYDRSAEHEILAANVEDYLRPIYESGSRYVVVVLGSQYGTKRWTMFEAGNYRSRIESGHVIPVRSTALPVDPFDQLRDIGRLTFTPGPDLWQQAKQIAATISRKLTTRPA